MSETLKPLFLNETGQAIVEELHNISEKMGGASGGGMALITYAELKALRDNGQLVAGQQYRITDYECTTVQENTQSAGHQFDIIVTADDENILNENARAIAHEGDTYFKDCNLAAWELKFSLDNDTERFAWASEDGKGVIYYMKDEWNNECPYDFKNIMFKRNIDLDNGYPIYDEDAPEMWVYTFTATSQNLTTEEWSGLKDGSLESPYGHESDENTSTFHHNIIKPYIVLYDNEDEDNTKCGKAYLNDNVFFGYYEEVGGGNPDDYPYYIAYCCYSNTLGSDCSRNTFGQKCHSNTLGSGCYGNTFGNSCYHNTLGSGCYGNTFGNSCYHNTFDTDCYGNTFGDGYQANTFGNFCNSNTFGDFCGSNTFGDSCQANTFGNSCNSNTFGNSCNSNTFGNDCNSNTFGNDCKNNKLLKNYMQYITLENGVQYVNVTCSATTSSGKPAQNIHINTGVAGTSGSNMKTCTISTANNAFLTTFGSANDVKINV